MSRESAPWYSRAFDAVYLEVYAHRDATEAERVTARLLEPLQLRERRVLDLACGAGRYGAALVRRGAKVVGLDLSAALLAVARKHTVACVRGDMQQLPFAPARFDLVLSMFTSFGYLAHADDDRRVLDEVRRVLVPEGLLVLDVMNAEAVRLSLPSRTHRTAGRFEIDEVRRLESDDVVVKEIVVRSAAEVQHYEERVRLWPQTELVETLAAARLPVRRCWGSYDGDAFDPVRSARLVVLAGGSQSA